MNVYRNFTTNLKNSQKGVEKITIYSSTQDSPYMEELWTKEKDVEGSDTEPLKAYEVAPVEVSE